MISRLTCPSSVTLIWKTLDIRCRDANINYSTKGSLEIVHDFIYLQEIKSKFLISRVPGNLCMTVTDSTGKFELSMGRWWLIYCISFITEGKTIQFKPIEGVLIRQKPETLMRVWPNRFELSTIMANTVCWATTKHKNNYTPCCDQMKLSWPKSVSRWP